MICFLCSSPIIRGEEKLYSDNGFIEELKRHYPKKCRALFIASDPDDSESMDFFAASAQRSFEASGFHFKRLTVLDGRNEEKAAGLIRQSNLIILAGGHVPTQNRFFAKIGLRQLLADYPGIIVGISAGTMNCADVVYAQPEEEGEAVDPAYERFLPGLNLTKTMILPHYQMVKDNVLDGLRIFEDIAYPDSFGKCFWAIPDGSYLYIDSGREELRGEAYRIRNGKITQVSEDGEVFLLSRDPGQKLL